jgi:hypothetical protein
MLREPKTVTLRSVNYLFALIAGSLTLVVVGAGLFRGFPETVAASGSVASLPIPPWAGRHAAARFTAYQQLSIHRHPSVDNS